MDSIECSPRGLIVTNEVDWLRANQITHSRLGPLFCGFRERDDDRYNNAAHSNGCRIGLKITTQELLSRERRLDRVEKIAASSRLHDVTHRAEFESFMYCFR